MEEGDALKLPNMTTINLLMREARRHHAHDKAFLLLNRVKEINSHTMFRRVKPDFATFSMLLHSATEGGDGDGRCLLGMLSTLICLYCVKISECRDITTLLLAYDSVVCNIV